MKLDQAVATIGKLHLDGRDRPRAADRQLEVEHVAQVPLIHQLGDGQLQRVDQILLAIADDGHEPQGSIQGGRRLDRLLAQQQRDYGAGGVPGIDAGRGFGARALAADPLSFQQPAMGQFDRRGGDPGPRAIVAARAF